MRISLFKKYPWFLRFKNYVNWNDEHRNLCDIFVGEVDCTLKGMIYYYFESIRDDGNQALWAVSLQDIREFLERRINVTKMY